MIIPGSNFHFTGKDFLDGRQLVSSKSDLKNWTEILPDGFEVYVQSEKSWYTYDSGNTEDTETGKFRKRKAGNDGIPILDSEMIEESRQKGELPDDYIQIDNLQYQIETQTSLDILFSAIRSLQAEVTRLKTSFQLGINSYTGQETASSKILYDLDDVEEEEPLWATQESELSGIFSLQFSDKTELIPEEGARVVLDGEGILKVYGGNANFIPTDQSGTEIEKIASLTDPKVLFYLTSDKRDVSIEFTSIEPDGALVETKTIDFSTLIPDKGNPTYAYLLIVSKRIKDKLSTEEYGKSFIWLTAQELIENDTIFEKYLNIETGTLSSSPINLEKNYFISKITITGDRESNPHRLSKFDIYTKYQDFSDHVEPVAPSEIEDIKYRAAHLTIRSIDTSSNLDRMIRKLQDNELVYVTSENALFIIYAGKKHRIGSGTDPEPTDTMTVRELFENLYEQGLITYKGADWDSAGNLTKIDNIELSKIASLSLINENTGKTYTYSPDSEGNLIGYVESPEIGKFDYIVSGDYETGDTPLIGKPSGGINKLSLPKAAQATRREIRTEYDDPNEGSTYNRGFISRIHGDDVSGNYDDDAGLNSDRIKIGSFYAPLATDKVHGCSHAFVELENTSDIDYYLDGCYLHYAGVILGTKSDGTTIQTQATYHLALKGKIPAGGTFLIRGKDYNSVNPYIKVETYDQEWYVNSVDYTPNTGYTYPSFDLISFDTYDISGSIVYGLALTFGNNSGTGNILYNTELVDKGVHGGVGNFLRVKPYLIDSLNFFTSSTLAAWNSKKNGSKYDMITNNPGNCIFKNMFELDPAKQAFQSYSLKDSSRFRGVNSADYQTLELKKEYIQFPHSNDTYPVSKFTPRASFEGKNICTDKSSLNPNKPNMVTVSFGISQGKTRCFNWISLGDYQEYVWIRKTNTLEWGRIESYWSSTNDSYTSSDIKYTRKDFNYEISWGTSNSSTVREIVYANPKYNNIFPGNKEHYKSHKCIVDITKANGTDLTIDSPIIFEYITGRSNSDGTPMEGYVSDIQTFTMYPSSYKPVIYQTSDQQGFHWQEYQAWAASADVINSKITRDKQTENIIPVLINTGDMTQNGTRINEWFDYYQAGRCLFNHLEQMNVVGNNDLGNIDETALGTGDDPGKSNPHFYNICYCYEIPISTNGTSAYLPIYKGSTEPKYIPSMYYFDLGSFRIFMGNSEITGQAAEKLFNSGYTDIYTGYSWTNSDNSNTSDVTAEFNSLTGNQFSVKIGGTTYTTGNHYLYEDLYNWMGLDNNTKNKIFVCHEMPFTVITEDNIGTGYQYSDRSISVVGGSTGLIGSHTNRIGFKKSKAYLTNGMTLRSKGTYWLSRLLEHYGIQYCLGGHKHTYACTWPLRENYYYDDGGIIKSSLTDGPMSMPASLENDNITFYRYNNQAVFPSAGNDTLSKIVGESGSISDVSNLTKFPITLQSNFTQVGGTYLINGDYADDSENYITCITRDSTALQNSKYVIYFMLQATGFKLKSNKELPGNRQKFSQIIPKTSTTDSKPGTSQIFPTFARIDLDAAKYSAGLDIRLMAIFNIVPNDTIVVFNQQSAFENYGDYKWNMEPEIRYFNNTTDIPYGTTRGSTTPNVCWTTIDRTLNLHFN